MRVRCRHCSELANRQNESAGSGWRSCAGHRRDGSLGAAVRGSPTLYRAGGWGVCSESTRNVGAPGRSSGGRGASLAPAGERLMAGQRCGRTARLRRILRGSRSSSRAWAAAKVESAGLRLSMQESTIWRWPALATRLPGTGRWYSDLAFMGSLHAIFEHRGRRPGSIRRVSTFDPSLHETSVCISRRSGPCFARAWDG